MTKDFLTKPNQGSIFKRFRDIIMRVMPQTYPNNGKQGNRKKNQIRLIEEVDNWISITNVHKSMLRVDAQTVVKIGLEPKQKSNNKNP